MPKKKEQQDLRFFVRLDNQPEIGEAVLRWSRLMGLDYPGEFIKMVLRRYAYDVAKSVGVTNESDKIFFEQNT